MLTDDEFIAFCQESEGRGHTVGTMPLWDSGTVVLLELAPGRQPLRAALIEERQWKLLDGAKRWKQAADERAKWNGLSGTGRLRANPC